MTKLDFSKIAKIEILELLDDNSVLDSDNAVIMEFADKSGGIRISNKNDKCFVQIIDFIGYE